MTKKTVIEPDDGLKIDKTLVTPERLEVLKKQAVDEVQAEAVKKAEATALASLKMQEQQRRNMTPKQKKDLVTFTLDLAEHSDRIVLDGVIYFHGQTYTRPRIVFDTVREIQAKGWRHQFEIDGKLNANAGRRPKNIGLAEVGGNIVTTHSLAAA